MKKILLVALACCVWTVGNAQRISTFAGNGMPENTSGGGSATDAAINMPQGICTDTAGNIYFGSSTVLRKVTPAGIISDIAGSSTTHGFSGDGGPATNALLQDIAGMAIDANGNIFIADQGNNRIRKINTSGIISTYCGNGTGASTGDDGPVNAATLSGPSGVAFDNVGNMYICDAGAHRVRKVNTAGIITAFAGTGVSGSSGDGGPATAAQFNLPYAVSADGEGNVYVAEYFENLIRKINTSGIVTTVAGTGDPSSYGDGGPATNAALTFPRGIIATANGTLYICDMGNDIVRKVDTSGIITTIAGIGTAGFSGDGGSATAALLNNPFSCALDRNGNLYITDQNNNRIRRVLLCTPPDAGTISGISTLYSSSAATLITSGDAGGIWTSSNTSVATIEGATGVISALSAGTATISYALSTTCDNALATYVVNVTDGAAPGDCSWTMSTIAGNGINGFGGDGGAATKARLSEPHSVAVDSIGNIYISSGYRIRKVTTSGLITTIGGNGGAHYNGDGGLAADAGMDPYGVAFDGAGNLYFADLSNSRIRKVSSSGIITTVAGTGTWGYTGNGGPATAAQINYPSALTVDGSGNIYFTDGDNNVVRKVSSSGIITTVAGSGAMPGYSGDGGPAISAQLAFPMGLAVDRLGNLYLSDVNNNRVRKVNTSGIITTIAGTGTAGFAGDGGPATSALLNSPAGIDVDSAGNLYITDAGNSVIRRIDGAGIISTIAGSGNPYSFNGDGGVATAINFYPTDVAVSNSGDAYITDMYNNRVRKIRSSALVAPITGLSAVDAGNSISLSDITPGGTWSSSDSAIARVDAYGVVTGLAAGNATISYVVSYACGTSLATKAITVNCTSPDAGTISGADAVCIATATTLTTNGNTGGAWMSHNSAIATIDGINGTVTGNSAGADTIHYVVSNACGADTATFLMNVVAHPNPGTITGADTVCVGAVSLFTTTGSGGTWQTSNPFMATIDASGSLYAINSGVVAISYTVSSATCGNAVSTYTVVIDRAPNATIVSADTIICAGHTLTLNATPSGGHWMSLTSTIATVNASGMVYGRTNGDALIAYMVTNICGSDVAGHYISVHAMPDATITSPATLCITDGTTTFTSVSMSGSDVWTAANDALSMAGNSAAIMHTGVDTITHITYNDCGDADTATLVVTILGLPDAGVITGTDTMGLGSSATLSASVAGGVWETTDPAIGTVDAAGVATAISPSDIFVIKYTVNNGCLSNSVSHVIVVLPCSENAGTIVGTDSVCAGAPATFSNPTATPGSWSSMFGLLSINAATGVATAISAGADTIIYTVTSSCGVLTSKFPVIVNPSPGAGSITGLADVCSGSSITLTSTIAGGNWTSGSTSVATVDSNGVVTGIAAGNAIITYSVASFSCGTVQSVHIVTVNPLPALSPISGPAVVAALSSVTLADTATGGLWTSSNTTIATIDTATGIATGIMPGSTVITYVKTNSAGCTSSVTHGLTTAGSLTSTTITPAVATLCHSIPVNMVANTVGGATDLIYQWYKNGVSIPGATNASYATTTSGFFHVVISNPAGSTVVAGVNILPSPVAIINITGSSTLYTGSFANYQWYKDHSPIPGASASIYNAMATGDYFVVVSDGNGCTDTSDNYHFVTTGITTAAGSGIAVNIYPNPVNNTVNIDAPVTVSVKVLAADGKIILEAREAKSLDVSRLAEGLYMIMVYNQDGQLLKAQKIVKAE